MRVEMIAIGNELLSGDVLDRNGARLGDALRRVGTTLFSRQTVRDDPAEIASALTLATARADFVVLSGGLGPTEDDLTVAAVARFANVSLIRDEAILTGLRQRFESRGVPWTENNACQADLPEGGHPLQNPVGTAPGVSIDVEGTQLLLLPGVHREFVAMMEAHVVPLVAEARGVCIASVVLRTWGRTESGIASTLEDVPPMEGAWLQYRASFPDIVLTAVGTGPTLHAAQDLADQLAAAVRTRLGDVVYAEGECSFEEVMASLLLEKQLSVATAESCTGGLIATKLTSIPGSSAYFLEGVVTYSNAAKRRLLGVSESTLDLHGAVSEATVREMVQGICEISGAQLGIAVSGLAGPEGGSPTKPVGTVHIAVALDGQVIHQCVCFPGGRNRVQELAARTALDMARRLCENNAA